MTGFLLFSFASLSGTDKEDVEKIFKNLSWYGHASFAIEADKIIYIDPWKIPDSAPKADLILVTHSHFDHFSQNDINLLKKRGTILICSSDCVSKASGDVRGITPGEEIEVQGIKIKAVPSYNPSKSFHPRNNKWLGYIVTVNGVSVYHAGDTDFIPEMRDLGPIHIALLPVGGHYTMNAEQAAKAANIIKADISIPMHYGAGVIGSAEDAQKFKDLCQGEVRILKETR
ncbi:MAG: MBL fold metallo-hydrolase [Candidatus Aminicenantes bacterium]|nr:MAG: MBL fold metallo-hydrolase [Candidatus Aminicenantes bacterium]